MSIYSDLQHALPDPLPDAYDLNVRQATIRLADNAPGNDPLLGITYQANYRHEEERGSQGVARIFTATAAEDSFFRREYGRANALDDQINPSPGLARDTAAPAGARQEQYVCQGDGVIAFYASTSAYDPRQTCERARAAIEFEMDAARKMPLMPGSLWRARRDELVQMAKDRGLRGYSAMKVDDLRDRIHRHDHRDLPDTHVRPGWLDSGDMLVLPYGGDDIFGHVLERLHDAAQAGYLCVGLGQGNPFSRGLTLCDERDLSEEFRARYVALNDVYCEDMEALLPVAQTLREGRGYHFLGMPQRREGEETRYFLNGCSYRLAGGATARPSGWFTLRELREGVHFERAEAEALNE